MAKPTRLVVHPPKFSGEREVKFFLEDFERAANANSWTEKVKLEMLPNFFTNAASTWCRTYVTCLRRTGAAAPDWATMKTHLTLAFQEVAPDVKNQMMLEDRRQKLDESVERYYYSVLNLCDEVDVNMDESKRVRYLIRGLRPNYLEKFLPLDPKLTSEVLTHMRKVAEGKFLISKQENDYYAKSIRHENKESGEITELKHMVEKAIKMIEDIRTDKNNVGSQSYCSYCHKENHVAADCWQKGKAEQNRLIKAKVGNGFGAQDTRYNAQGGHRATEFRNDREKWRKNSYNNYKKDEANNYNSRPAPGNKNTAVQGGSSRKN